MRQKVEGDMAQNMGNDYGTWYLAGDLKSVGFILRVMGNLLECFK